MRLRHLSNALVCPLAWRKHNATAIRVSDCPLGIPSALVAQCRGSDSPPRGSARRTLLVRYALIDRLFRYVASLDRQFSKVVRFLLPVSPLALSLPALSPRGLYHYPLSRRHCDDLTVDPQPCLTIVRVLIDFCFPLFLTLLPLSCRCFFSRVSEVLLCTFLFFVRAPVSKSPLLSLFLLPSCPSSYDGVAAHRSVL